MWQNAVVALCLLPFAGPGLTDVRPLDWLWIGLLGVFCTGVAHSLFVASLAVVVVLTLAAGWLSWRLVEAPALRLKAYLR